VEFPHPLPGPLVIGDGRWLGLGLMRPIPEEPPAVHLFGLEGKRARVEQAETLTRALRRAVMARVQSQLGRGETLAPFFTGHLPGGSPARPGQHRHLFFLVDDADADGYLDRVAVVAPQLADRSTRTEWRQELRLLDRSLEDLIVLRAGPAGVNRLVRLPAPDEDDAVFGRAYEWVSRTPYRPTRHPRCPADATEALCRDVSVECDRRGLPRPMIDVVEIAEGPRGGIAARLKLSFAVAIAGPVLLGAGSHFGAGLFSAAPLPRRIMSP
jgi:CRISPR-associated protein Csb2